MIVNSIHRNQGAAFGSPRLFWRREEMVYRPLPPDLN
jgi:hypothetical protein